LESPRGVKHLDGRAVIRCPCCKKDRPASSFASYRVGDRRYRRKTCNICRNRDRNLTPSALVNLSRYDAAVSRPCHVCGKVSAFNRIKPLPADTLAGRGVRPPYRAQCPVMARERLRLILERTVALCPDHAALHDGDFPEFLRELERAGRFPE